jgi:ankyrin repeat protein
MNQEFLKAVTEGDVAKVKEMLKADATLARAKDQNGLSAILKATYYRQKEIVAVLLASGVEMNIFEASATGDTGRVRRLITHDPSLANAYSSDGFMPLGLATFFGHRETVEALLKGGADVNAVSKESMKVAPLNSAAAAGQVSIARILLAHGAKVDTLGGEDFTPLHEVAAKGDIEFATLLLEHGADVNKKSKAGKTPLSLAVQYQRVEMAQFLRKHGATQ